MLWEELFVLDWSSAGGRVVGQLLTCSNMLPGKTTNPTSNVICQSKEFMLLRLDQMDRSILIDIRMLNMDVTGTLGWISCWLHSLGYLDFEGPGFPPSSAFFCFCCIISASLQETGKRRKPLKLLIKMTIHLITELNQQMVDHFLNTQKQTPLDWSSVLSEWVPKPWGLCRPSLGGPRATLCCRCDQW